MVTEAINLIEASEAAVRRGTEPNCLVQRGIMIAAQRLSYEQAVEDTILRGAAKVYLSDYDPTTIQAPAKVYYAPHRIGKPQDFTVEFQTPDELFQGWFNENPVETDPIA